MPAEVKDAFDARVHACCHFSAASLKPLENKHPPGTPLA
jgi:hypothetical protein